METDKIGVIKEAIIIMNTHRKGSASLTSQWGYIGMLVEIVGIHDFHYRVIDPDGIHKPIYAVRGAIEIIEIKWKQLEVNTCK
jgi:hypothetical protein